MFQQAMFDDTAGNLIRHPEGPEVDRIWNFEHFPISVRFFWNFHILSTPGWLSISISFYIYVYVHIYIYMWRGPLCIEWRGLGKKSFQDL